MPESLRGLGVSPGLGVTRLSMSARALPAVRAALTQHTLAECERLTEAALANYLRRRTRAGDRRAGRMSSERYGVVVLQTDRHE